MTSFSGEVFLGAWGSSGCNEVLTFCFKSSQDFGWDEVSAMYTSSRKLLSSLNCSLNVRIRSTISFDQEFLKSILLTLPKVAKT